MHYPISPEYMNEKKINALTPSPLKSRRQNKRKKSVKHAVCSDVIILRYSEEDYTHNKCPCQSHIRKIEDSSHIQQKIENTPHLTCSVKREFYWMR
jgi:hypothetical protein